jgi:hypothetical protein
MLEWRLLQMGLLDMVYILPIVVIAVIILAAPISLEKTNAKRDEKGKPALTEDEFARIVRRDRIICVVILAAGTVLALVIRNFGGRT